MQTKQLKTGEVYAYKNGKYGATRLVVALGPHYLAAPKRYAYTARQVNPDERGYKIVLDRKGAEGIALLEADLATQKKLDAWIDLDGETPSWSVDIFQWNSVKHVIETMKLLQTGERVELNRLDVPTGWNWTFTNPQHVVGPYLPHFAAERDYEERAKAAKEKEQDAARRGQARADKIITALRERNILDEGHGLLWTDYGRLVHSPDPKLQVPLSVLEKLLGLDK